MPSPKRLPKEYAHSKTASPSRRKARPNYYYYQPIYYFVPDW